MKSKVVHLIGWGTLLGFGGLGLLVNFFLNNSGFLTSSYSLLGQLLIGLSYGLISALVIIRFVQIPFIAKDCQKYVRLVKSLNLNYLACIFLSLCAAFGEELFFRVALQPNLGIVLTSILFVAVHGYLNIKRPIFYYGVLMVFVVAGIGTIYSEIGFWAACSSHFMIDLVLFRYLGQTTQLTEEHL